MFENLTKRLHTIFQNIAGCARLTEKNIEESLRQIRTSLLEADVNYKVVIDFIDKIRQKAIGQRILSSITPTQMFVKIVYDELVGLLGRERFGLDLTSEPSIIMTVGLYGSGKTTTCGKLAKVLISQGKKPLLVALDTQRPAAVLQVEMLGNELGVDVVKPEKLKNVIKICEYAISYAKKNSKDVIILDTAGRWHIENDLISELVNLKNHFSPQEILLIVDSTMGQDAVNMAREFNEKLELSGFILTKIDGDSRGGAAVSIKAITGKPIKFIGVGEHLGDLEEFYPERIASRILGMGDILTLVEKIEKAAREEEKRKEEQLKKKRQELNLDDFLKSIRQIRKIAPLAELLKMMPMGSMFGGAGGKPDKELKRIEAIISSMTLEERRNPEILDGSRRKRIALGSGTTPHEINLLLQRFEKMKDSMKKMQKHIGPGGIQMPKKPFPFPPRF